MQKPRLKGFRAALNLTEKMLHMANHNEAHYEYDSSLLINAVIRDCAYKIRDAVEREYRRLRKQADETPQQLK